MSPYARRGVMSEVGAHQLGVEPGTRVKYEPHPKAMMAKEVWDEATGKYIGGYVSVGPEGIIDSEGLKG